MRPRSSKVELRKMEGRKRANTDQSGCIAYGVDLNLLDTGIVGSNSVQGMDVYPRLSVLCFPV
jgi:hypothetical protein